MLINHLRLAWRVIRRNKLFSLVAIGCLAIGLAVSMTILSYVLHEHSFEKWQVNARRIFSVEATVHFGDGSFNVDEFNYGVGPLVRQNDPDVEGFVRLIRSNATVVNPAKPDLVLATNNSFVYADSNFYRFFSLRLARGNAASVLVRPLTIVVTERAAKKLFGSDDVIGKSLHVDGSYDFEITGVAADPPSNTDLQYDYIASLSSAPRIKDIGNVDRNPMVSAGFFRTWLLLRDARGKARVERTIQGLATDKKDDYFLTALTDRHLSTHFGTNDSIQYLSIFPVVAGLILLLALVNYMSLATAQSTARSKEVGVRKVLGARRGRLAGQFYTESALLAGLAFLLGGMLFLLLRRFFSALLQLNIDAKYLLSPEMIGGGVLLLVGVIGVAGSYPSVVLSGFRPVAVLYGRLTRGKGQERIRKGFIVFQFTISMVLVLCSILIEKELYYIRHTETGLNRENVVMIRFHYDLKQYGAFKREVAGIPGIVAVSTSRWSLYGGNFGLLAEEPGTGKKMDMDGLYVDDEFIPMLGLKWSSRQAPGGESTDGRHLVLNETAVEKLGLKGDPVGQYINVREKRYAVAGVLANFNYRDLRSAIAPLLLFVARDTSQDWVAGGGGFLLAKIGVHVNVPTTIGRLKQTYQRFDKKSAFEFSFADEAFDRQYKAEDRLAGLMGIFTGVTVVIACMGLFALATFAAQQRLKEIGIRKVLGASVASISGLLSWGFLRPVLLAVVIACPVAWAAMNKWLDNFAYRTPVSWWLFVTAGLGLLGIALVTVVFRSLRAARTNPVENLRVQ